MKCKHKHTILQMLQRTTIENVTEVIGKLLKGRTFSSTDADFDLQGSFQKFNRFRRTALRT